MRSPLSSSHHLVKINIRDHKITQGGIFHFHSPPLRISTEQTTQFNTTRDSDAAFSKSFDQFELATPEQLNPRLLDCSHISIPILSLARSNSPQGMAIQGRMSMRDDNSYVRQPHPRLRNCISKTKHRKYSSCFRAAGSHQGTISRGSMKIGMQILATPFHFFLFLLPWINQ